MKAITKIVDAVKNESIPVKVYNCAGEKGRANSTKVETPSISLDEEI